MKQNKNKNAGANPIDAEIAKLNAQLADLNAKREQEAAAAAAKQKEMIAALPAQFGVATLPEFIALVSKVGGIAKGKRAKVTVEMKEQIRKLSVEGKTGNEIAEIVGVSVPTIQNVRKELGLVKARAAKPAPAAA